MDDKHHAEGARSFASQLRLALPAAPARSDGLRSKEENSAQMQQAEESAQVLNEVNHSIGVQGYSSSIKYAEATCVRSGPRQHSHIYISTDFMRHVLLRPDV